MSSLHLQIKNFFLYHPNICYFFLKKESLRKEIPKKGASLPLDGLTQFHQKGDVYTSETV